MTDINSEFLFKCPVSFLLEDQQGQNKANGKAQALLEPEKLSLLTDAGDSLVFPLRDIMEIREKDYHLLLIFSFPEHLDLFNLGYKFEDFAGLLTKKYHEIILQDMLVYEKIRKKDVAARFTWETPGGGNHPAAIEGKCEIRVYETSLVILPSIGQVIRIPFGHIKDLQPGDYNITITTDPGEKACFSHLGNQRDALEKTLCDSLNQLSLKTQEFLRELLPDIDPLTIRQLSHLLKDGKIAGRKEIESISPKVWPDLEKAIRLSPLADEYDFLKSLGREEKIAVGFKRGLMGGLKQDYFWFLIPLRGEKPGEPANAAAFEAGTIRLPDPGSQDDSLLEQDGKATYFFRLLRNCQKNLQPLEENPGSVSFLPKPTDDNKTRQCDGLLRNCPENRATIGRNFTSVSFLPKPADDDKTRQWDGLDLLADELIISLNRCLREINFRREPIYLPEEKLKDPRYSKYKYAIYRLPGLRRLRGLFMGRVIHKSPGQWREDVTALLKRETPAPGLPADGCEGE